MYHVDCNRKRDAFGNIWIVCSGYGLTVRFPVSFGWTEEKARKEYVRLIECDNMSDFCQIP